MFTPQQIQQVSFERAVFGGYDMGSVDDFLEPLTEDYITLYKENAVLKSKLRVLVEKLEEYRKQESSMKNAIVAAQKTCDDMIADAQRKCARLMNDAEAEARSKTSNLDAEVDSEQERLARAKAATADFISTVEAEIQRQLEVLNNLKMMDLATERREKKPAAAPKRAYDYEAEQPKPEKEPALETEEDIASEIQLNLEKLVGSDDVASEDPMGDTKVMKPLHTGKNNKFADLQFGKNYDPTKKK